jgi:hypothetical protein
VDLERRLYDRWKNKPNTYEWNDYEKLIYESFYIYMERYYLQEESFVDDFVVWRKQRTKALCLIKRIEENIDITYNNYKSDRNDPPVQICSNNVIFEEWKSLNIIIEDVNFFGYISQKNWLVQFGKLSEHY